MSVSRPSTGELTSVSAWRAAPCFWPFSSNFARQGLSRSRSGYDSGQRLEEDIEVKPERCIADVEEIVRLLRRQIAIAPGRDLPIARQSRRNAGADCSELVVETLDVIIGERPRPDHAHVAAKHVPDLRQL